MVKGCGYSSYHMVPLRAILRRLDVSLHSFVYSSMYAEVYNTFLLSGRSAFIDLVDQTCGQCGESLVSPLCSCSIVTVPIKLMFMSRRFPCSSTVTFPEINWHTCTCSSYLYVSTTRLTTCPIELNSKMAKSHSHRLHAQIFDCISYGS